MRDDLQLQPPGSTSPPRPPCTPRVPDTRGRLEADASLALSLARHFLFDCPRGSRRSRRSPFSTIPPPPWLLANSSTSSSQRCSPGPPSLRARRPAHAVDSDVPGWTLRSPQVLEGSRALSLAARCQLRSRARSPSAPEHRSAQGGNGSCPDPVEDAGRGRAVLAHAPTRAKLRASLRPLRASGFCGQGTCRGSLRCRDDAVSGPQPTAHDPYDDPRHR